jgi:ribosomal protein S18 acetylase RimI-like enzyme
MMGKFEVQRATVSDAETITRFNLAMALETEEKRLNPERVLAGVHGLMNKPELGFYLVATHEDRVAGSLMVTYEWSDWRCGVFWWVQSVYVEPEYRRQGVYRCLYAYLKELATKAGGVCGFRLYVEEENVKAQKTYESLGMNACAYRMYEEEMAGYVPVE